MSLFSDGAPVDAAPANARTSSSWHDARALKLGERPHRDARAERKSRFFFESGSRNGYARVAGRGEQPEASGYVVSELFSQRRFLLQTPRRPLRRLTDSPRAFPRRDAQLPDAAFCCATRIIYLWKETGFFRGQSRRSFARREKKNPRAGFWLCVRATSRRSFHARSGWRSSSWVLGFDRRGARPFDARVPFDRGRGGREGHVRPPGS